ncbi:hypothetical protein [Heterosigma akashiwo virus 01]|uniref:Uncharacterized protein n=1 Tax=Heterosigma akashiwo virus 01 TaxID=97195 RepID=A0A1C9C5L0_HAV01|nr:hypothetical protein D1R72_gp234 [Heterosigma akashiwo virus 01]AOM63565.1 hypothetical protein [Heterosigma akashiwo virus 01]
MNRRRYRNVDSDTDEYEEANESENIVDFVSNDYCSDEDSDYEPDTVPPFFDEAFNDVESMYDEYYNNINETILSKYGRSNIENVTNIDHEQKKLLFNMAKNCNTVYLYLKHCVGFEAMFMLLVNPNLIIYRVHDMYEPEYMKECFKYIIDNIDENRLKMFYTSPSDFFTDNNKLIFDLFYTCELIETIRFSTKCVSYILFENYDSDRLMDSWNHLIENKKIHDLKYDDNVNLGLTQASLPIIVSMTVIKSRLENVNTILDSIAKQSVLPSFVQIFYSDTIHLLDEGITEKEMKKNMAKFNKDFPLSSNKLHVKTSLVANTGSYRKLFSTLEKYSIIDNDPYIIITIDDDTLYKDRKFIESLRDAFMKTRSCVACRGKRLEYDNDDCSFVEYEKMSSFNSNSCVSEELERNHVMNFFTGVYGVLYYSRFFNIDHDFFLNSEIYTKKCSTSDDVWINLYLSIVRCIKKYIINKKHSSYKDINRKNKKKTLFRLYNKNINSVLINLTYDYFVDL